MRKVFVFNMTSLDGYFTRPNGELDWHNVDAEFNEFAIKQLSEVDTLLFGRKTYDLMAGYWQSEAAITNDPVVAGIMNKTAKIVVSRTLDKTDWHNTRLLKDNLNEELKNLKAHSGKDIAILGSSSLAVSLAKMSLIDEFRMMVNPIILGDGNSIFQGLSQKLELTATRCFDSGNVLLTYRPLM